MSNVTYYFWLIVLIVYILSPLDLHPLFLDDLIASGVLFYLLYRNVKQKKQRIYSYSSGQSQENRAHEHFGLQEAFRLLDVKPDTPWQEIKKAYKEKITRSHPDKVAHMSEELQEKAKELTLMLNKALDIIKRSKKIK